MPNRRDCADGRFNHRKAACAQERRCRGRQGRRQIAKVSAPGSVFGELAVLLDQPHTADVRTLEQCEFHIADAPALLAGDPTVALYVAAILAQRLDGANRALIEVKRQLQAGEPRSAIGRTVEKMEELLSFSGTASLAYAGYPYDPFGADNSTR
jgi:CRP/FNR family transcriptional regulator, cyclic AMP receptor protein